MNTWSLQLASNTVQYTFALSQPAANEFALFETHNPWHSTFIKDAITANGHTYTEFTPADLARVNFSDYRVVILNWDDTSALEFIAPYTAAIPALEAYVGAGGVVWVQAAIQGNPGDNYPDAFRGPGESGQTSATATRRRSGQPDDDRYAESHGGYVCQSRLIHGLAGSRTHRGY